MRKDFILSAALLVILVAAAVISAGCTGTTDTTAPATATPTPEAPPAETATEATPAPTTAAPEAPATTFDGTGTGNFTVSLAGGVHLLTVTQDSPAKTTVSISTEKDYVNAEGTLNEAVTDEAMKDGKYTWSYAFMLEEDAEATVQVEATGNWTLYFSFPQQINGIVPQNFKGIGTTATPFFQINEGTYDFSIQASNNDMVEVHLMDFSGNDVEKKDRQMPLSFHEGTYDDVVTVAVNESNNYLLNVVCDGDWTVSVAEA
ncbi:hypothetical protein [Methanogenium organophilum]|uniref:Uncharacterized protein n=1 Tax=Methanogenium organophilum TaxID=2199 RepID=A0A9X9S6A1_METOG|nr:hypothetical protein [Methanogenium organophilum]WAI02203.1 hypothetical protein OU421_04840 [Methanogenium organophilum]